MNDQLRKRIEKIDKKIFFILSTARCRSSWFSNLFTYKDSFCYNEETRYIKNWNQFIDRIEKRPENYVGFEDPELLHYIISLYELFPNATYVLLERDRRESENSLQLQSNQDRDVISYKFDRWYKDIDNFKSLVSKYSTIDFNQMDDINHIKRIWNYVLPDSFFDVDRWNLLTSLKISVTIGNKPHPIPFDTMASYWNFQKLKLIR